MSSGEVNDVQQWGRSLFERQQQPVEWAGRILEVAALALGSTPEIQVALQVAADQKQWDRGREVFELVRRRSLNCKSNPTEQLLFRLAELVGKLAHNSAGSPPYFDYHAGWQIGPIAYNLACEMQDSTLRNRLAAVLGDWPSAEPGSAS